MLENVVRFLLFSLVCFGVGYFSSSIEGRYRQWRITRGRSACVRGEHAWVPRPPHGDEWLLPWLRPVRCARCNVRARLSGGL